MKTIGLLGGMSWESTTSYYQIINRAVRDRLGGVHSARLCLYSVEFGEIEALMEEGQWEKVSRILSEAAGKLEAAGADFILICTNTMHKLAPQIEQAVTVPLLHIADAAADALEADGVRCAGLLGTRPTMEQDFCKERIAKRGIRILTPPSSDMDIIHKVIFSELCAGIFRDESRRKFLEVIDLLAEQGAEGVILGCTEIPLLVSGKDSSLKLYDTTELHALAAVERALS